MPTADSVDWTWEEVEAIVAAYLGMLEKQLSGVPINKAEENRKLAQVIKRSKGSIERKHGNVSAVMVEMGYGYLSGYKPLPHYQNLLWEVIEDRLSGRRSLEAAAVEFVQKPVKQPLIEDILKIQVAPPHRGEVKQYVRQGRRAWWQSGRPNYLEMEARNRSLGRAGEELILRFEHERLWRAGQNKLADRIEHVSEAKGDSLGYDILSFETDGSERLIEVKTTRFGMHTPFFASKNEVEVSDVHTDDYHLYRIYDFGDGPRFFDLNGSLHRTCILDPVQYSARVC